MSLFDTVVNFAIHPWYGAGKWLFDKFKRAEQSPQEPGRPPQTAAYGKVVPLAYGTVRLTGNLLYLDSADHDILLGPVRFLGRYAIVALCEGEMTGILRQWIGKQCDTIGGYWVTATTRPGTVPQTAFAADPDGNTYPGIALILLTVSDYMISSLAERSWEIKARLAGTGGALDANPADIVLDMLGDQTRGAGAWFPVDVEYGLDGLAASSARNYVTAEGLFLSPAFTDRRPADEHLRNVLDSCNCTGLWTEGALKIVPLGDTAATGNGLTYAPIATVIYALDAANGDFIEPIEMSLTPSTEVFNVAPVEFLERAPAAAAADPSHAYNVSVVDDPEPLDVFNRQERRASPVQLHAITQREVALKISRLRAQQMVYPRTRYRFKTGWRYWLLEPLDLISLTDPALGLSAKVARIDSIEEDEKGGLTIEAVEWTAGIGTVLAHTTSSSDGPTGNRNPLDGITAIHRLAMKSWTLRQSLTTWIAKGVCAANGVIVAVGGSQGLGGNAAKCATSTDGATWTERTIAGYHDYLDVAWTGSLFVAGGPGAGAGVSTSPDGVTWTFIGNLPFNPARVAGMNGTIVIGGSGGLAYSTNSGQNWTACTMGGPGLATFVPKSVTVGRGKFIAAAPAYNGVNGPWVSTSDDGITWTAPENAGASAGVAGQVACDRVVWGDDTCVMAGDTLTNRLALWSSDLTNWYVVTMPTPSATWIKAVFWTGRVFVALSYFNAIDPASVFVSSDGGRSWTYNRTALPLSAPWAAAMADDFAVAVGDGFATSMSV